jgi:hypothetical protein
MSYQIEVASHKESHQIELQNLLINWIICDNIPLNVVHSEVFCKLIKNLDSVFFILNVKLIKQIIHKAYNHSINLIQEFLDNNLVSVNLTTDMWTGRNR